MWLNVGQYFSKIFFFKQTLILSGYFLKIFIWSTFANICRSKFFEKKPISKMPAVFSSLAQCFSDPEFSKSTKMKSQWEIFILKIKSRPTMIVKNCPNKNLSRFLLRRKFRLIFESKNILPLWSTAAGDEEVGWLQKTNLDFHTSRILFWGNFFFHNTIKHRFYTKF